jgi:hypothetical protein
LALPGAGAGVGVEAGAYAAAALGSLAATPPLQAAILRAAPGLLRNLARTLTLGGNDDEETATEETTAAAAAAVTAAVAAAGALQRLLEAPGAWALGGNGGDGNVDDDSGGVGDSVVEFLVDRLLSVIVAALKRLEKYGGDSSSGDADTNADTNAAAHDRWNARRLEVLAVTSTGALANLWQSPAAAGREGCVSL